MRRLIVLGVFSVSALPLAGQSSQFGVRGLGLPLRPLSVRAAATGGSFGLFDFASAQNPASFGVVGRVDASFQTLQTWTSSENPLGTSSRRDNRYPGIFITGPIGGTRLALAVSASGFTDRNFALVSRDTILLRDLPVEVLDTITSLGGMSDLRFAVAWRRSPAVQIGGGLHLLTGSNRISSHRVFSDSAYLGATERNTLSYLGFGVSAGATVRLIPSLTIAGMARIHNTLRVERDTTRVASIALPVTLAGGARLQLGPRLQLAGAAQFRNWSVSDSALRALGGIGSVNTTEWSAGLEFIPDPARPFRRTLRLGFHRADLPFLLRPGVDISETGVSAGTSTQFGGGRIRLDLALSRIWRRGGPDFSERAFLLNLGIAIAPPGLR